MKKEEYTYLGGLVHGIGTLLTGMKTTMKVYYAAQRTERTSLHCLRTMSKCLPQ